MRYLIDTHVLVWYLNGDDRLSVKLRDELDDENNVIIVSIASLWELTIKMSKEKKDIRFKITLPQLQAHIFERDYMLLNVSFKHLKVLEKLPKNKYHGDPFDRMIIAQAIAENLTILSVDRHFAAYPVNVIW